MLDWKYFRLFEKTGSKGPTPKDLEKFLKHLHALTRFRTATPAGYTYFGQFIDHDLSFMDLTDTLDVSSDQIGLDDLWQRRRAALDLDSIYGGGFEDSHVPFSKDSGKFYIGLTASGEKRDLPRRKDAIALVADARNDDNLLVAQFQVLWMNFHNRVADYYCSQGYRGGKKLYQLARNEVINVYRELVLHDFGRTILPYAVYREIVCRRNGLLSKPDKSNPMLALEFPAAAFRLHGMIRNTYALNKDESDVDLVNLLLLTGRGNKAGKGNNFPLPDNFVVDWRYLFPIDKSIGHGFAMQISPLTPTLELPNKLVSESGIGMALEAIGHFSHESINRIHNESMVGKKVDIAELTTKRGAQLSLPTGQEVKTALEKAYPDLARKMGLKDIRSDILEPLRGKNSIVDNTPLWLYIMLEARGEFDGSEFCGAQLGILGGWLVADSLVNASLSVDLDQDCEWKPEDSVIYKGNPSLDISNNPGGHITLRDMICFTYEEYLPGR